MKLRKATAAILISSLIIWLIIAILGFAFGFSFHRSMKSGEGLGFLFVAIFLALFEVIGFGASILALAFALMDIFALIALAKGGRGWVICTGVMALLLGSPVAGICMLCIAHKEKPRG